VLSLLMVAICLHGKTTAPVDIIIRV
jgi:hypothetical protein